MDVSNWTAVLEALDEVESRIPEDNALEFTFLVRLNELRWLAKREREFARLGTGRSTRIDTGEG
jgi:hypothetical protein